VMQMVIEKNGAGDDNPYHQCMVAMTALMISNSC